MSKSSIKTVVLVSTENFVWHSMQEIIPSLEQLWLDSQQEGVHEVMSVNIDKVPMKEYLPALIVADNIVISCFTFKMAQLTKFFRDEMGLAARYIIHLHNQSTIACWPFHKFGLGGRLRQEDIFISSCTRDLETFCLGFEKAQVECVPFTFNKGIAPDRNISVVHKGDKDFVYIGRLSVQKNLHTLIWAYSILLKRHPQYTGKLIFIGGEDDLGSPNMDMKSSGYLQYLQNLVNQLSMNEKVEFTGHMQREDLYRRLTGKDYVFVTPSLHSDENFGMAAFRALVEGRQTVMTDWGGHADYIQSFPNQVELIPVYGEEKGPWVSPYELASGLEKASGKNAQGYNLPKVYTAEEISRRYTQIALRESESAGALKISELTEKVLKARESYSTVSATRVFSSYEDSNVQPFFKGYGMRSLQPQNFDNVKLAPWVSEEDGRWIIQDIHRGDLIIEVSSKNPKEIYQFDGTRKVIEESLLDSFIRNGWAVSEL